MPCLTMEVLYLHQDGCLQGFPFTSPGWRFGCPPRFPLVACVRENPEGWRLEAGYPTNSGLTLVFHRARAGWLTCRIHWLFQEYGLEGRRMDDRYGGHQPISPTISGVCGASWGVGKCRLSPYGVRAYPPEAGGSSWVVCDPPLSGRALGGRWVSLKGAGLSGGRASSLKCGVCPYASGCGLWVRKVLRLA